MQKTPILVCVLAAAALATACGADEGSRGKPPSASTDTTQASGGSTAPASRRGEPSAAKFKCDPADANRPDKPREEVGGAIAPAVPRRTCTLPREGCVTTRNSERPVPPAPGVRVVRVTPAAIDIAYNLGTDLSECQPESLSVAVYVTISGLAPDVRRYRVSSSTGSLRIKPRRLPGTTDYGPADALMVESATEAGLASEAARVGLPPPEGERRPSDAEVRRIKGRREACRANIDERTSCETGGLHPVSGPITEATPAQLTRSVRDSLKASGGFSILRVKCINGTRCDAAFRVGGHRLEMSYRIQALKSVPTCWELTAFSVTRPVPELGNVAAPLPSQGCVDR